VEERGHLIGGATRPWLRLRPHAPT
jgi:hypothetical protein